MRAVAILFCAALAGCTSLGIDRCPAGLKSATTVELYFGRNIGAAEGVSDADWHDFVTKEIAPRFPDGFTLSDASGAWKGRDGAAVHERAKRLFIVLSGKPGEQAALEAVRAAYKSRFHQDSVLLLESEGCVSF